MAHEVELLRLGEPILIPPASSGNEAGINPPKGSTKAARGVCKIFWDIFVSLSSVTISALRSRGQGSSVPVETALVFF